MRLRALEENGVRSPTHRANLIIHELMIGGVLDVGLIQAAIIGAIEMAEVTAFHQGAQDMRRRAVEKIKELLMAPDASLLTAIGEMPLEEPDEPGPRIPGQ